MIQGLFPSENRLNICFPYFYSLEKTDGKLIFLSSNTRTKTYGMRLKDREI